MIRVAICEDDLYYAEKEKNLIETYLGKYEIRSEIVTFTTSEDLLKSYTDSFDIVFLDIEHFVDTSPITITKKSTIINHGIPIVNAANALGPQ